MKRLILGGVTVALVMVAGAVDFRELGGTDGDAAAVLNAAFARGVREVRFSKGEYRLGSVLRLPSGARLLADSAARFVVSPGMATRWIVTNADHEKGNVDIVVSGGVWDGNCDERPGKKFDPKSVNAGLFFHFHSVKGLKLTGFRAYDSLAYHISLSRVTDFEITDLYLGGELRPFCQDGIHMGGGCERGTIRNIVAHTNGMGDDLIALNADDVFFYPWNQDQVALPIRDITVNQVVASNCYTVIRLLSISQPIERCTFRNFIAGYRAHGINIDAARYCSHPIFNDSEHPEGVGALRDVVFENFDLWYSGDKAPGRELVTYETNGRGVEFRNFRFRRDLDAFPDHDRPVVLLCHLGKTKMTKNGETAHLERNRTLSVKDRKIESLILTSEED